MPSPMGRRPPPLSCAAISANRWFQSKMGNEMAAGPGEISLEEQCVARNMRMTEQRRVIARVLEGATDHPDVEELYRRASAIDPKISLSTVYRTVNLFEEAGLVTRHDFRDGRA